MAYRIVCDDQTLLKQIAAQNQELDNCEKPRKAKDEKAGSKSISLITLFSCRHR